jgi:hypothetical protein
LDMYRRNRAVTNISSSISSHGLNNHMNTSSSLSWSTSLPPPTSTSSHASHPLGQRASQQAQTSAHPSSGSFTGNPPRAYVYIHVCL